MNQGGRGWQRQLLDLMRPDLRRIPTYVTIYVMIESFNPARANVDFSGDEK